MSDHHQRSPRVLATDLDGTLIPLNGQLQQVQDLRTIEAHLARSAMLLMFVTGRHFASILSAIESAQLPRPDWIIGDVGTSLYRRTSSHRTGRDLPLASANDERELSQQTAEPSEDEQCEYEPLPEYAQHLRQLVGDFGVDRLAESLQGLRLSKGLETLRMQEPAKQGPFKLSYNVDLEQLPAVQVAMTERVEQLQAPYTLVVSRDPYCGIGLVDLLPQNVSKAHAITWWARQQQIERDDILFAGDSGNDSAVFAAGFRSIIVGNAAEDVVQAAKAAHADGNWKDRIYVASDHATSGVLAGIRHFCS